MPTLPPHIVSAQSKAYVLSVLEGDPDSAGTIRAVMKDAWEAMKPNTKA